jgi:PAS domain S-box-containing protein
MKQTPSTEPTADWGWAVEDRERFFTISLDMLCVAGFDGYFKRVNPAWGQVLGYTTEELLAEPFLTFVHPDDQERTAAEAAKLATGETTIRFDNRYRCKDGSYRWMQWTASPHVALGLIYAAARDISEQVRLEDELREAKEQAERANLAKSEFLSRMSHELRTPLNAILGFAQLLELDELASDQADSVAQILKGGKHLLELINEVLDLARIESGRLSLSLEAVDLGEVVKEAHDLMGPLAARLNVRLERTPSETWGHHVRADRRRLAQVLLNLLGNAVKFNREGGRVTIGCEDPGEGRIRVKIEDTGYGIPPEHMANLFDPFNRLGAEQTQVEGTGLGLALSKRLVEAMGGTIGVQSKRNEGSTFFFELPLAVNPVDQLEGDGAPARDDLSWNGSPRTVLYIEDNLANLRLIERILTRRPDLKLLAAMQGGVGLDLAREHGPDLILLDLDLPDVPGAEVLRRLRADAATRDIPVVIISADASPSQIRRLVAAGAGDYLTKPIDVRRLLEVLDETLSEKVADDAAV